MKKLDSIAVVVLTKGYDNLDYYQTLIDRNNSIFDTFADKTNKQLDFLIFHEGNMPQSHMIEYYHGSHGHHINKKG